MLVDLMSVVNQEGLSLDGRVLRSSSQHPGSRPGGCDASDSRIAGQFLRPRHQVHWPKT